MLSQTRCKAGLVRPYMRMWNHKFLIKLWCVLTALLPMLPYTLYGEELTLNGAGTEVYFSPKGGAEEAIVRAIGNARREICVLAYSFTSAPVNSALEAAHQRGVKVRVILDKSQLTARGGKIWNLCDVGIPVFIDGSHAIAHNKVMIIDKRRVVTGSFNFTQSAETRNAENLLIIKSRKLSKKYRQDFDKHLTHAKPALCQ